MSDKLFTVRDVKSESYMSPFVCKSRGEALRSFSDEAMSGSSLIAKHPSDFHLFELGTFDPHTGLIVLYDQMAYVAAASDFTLSPPLDLAVAV